MARTREFDETVVKDALRDVFWKGGYDGTSYSDIMKATGLKKGSLYAAFGDKRALYQVALARYDQEEVSGAVSMLRDTSLSSVERITRLMGSTVEATQSQQGRWGCLLCNAATEVAPTDADVETSVQAMIERLDKAIEFALTPIDKVTMSQSILSSYFGARTLVKAGYKEQALRAVQNGVLALIEN